MTRLECALAQIKPAVRSQQPYLVGMPGDHITVKLNQNESPFDLPVDLKKQILKVWVASPFNRYPNEQPNELCDALASHLGWDEAGIVVGNGSNELMYSLSMACLSSTSRVVLPRPMFSFYEKVVRLSEGVITSVPPRPDLSFDTEKILEAVIDTEPALVVLVTPNNPTGMAMTIDEIRAIVDAAPGLVLVDEAYMEFSTERSAHELLTDYPNLILVRTFSKAFGLAGLRLGYLLGHPDLMAELLKARVPFMVDRLSECAAIELLKQPELMASRCNMIQAGVRELYSSLVALAGFDVLPTQANFVVFRPPVSSHVVMNSLSAAGVLVRDMSGYPELAGWLRVTAGTRSENRHFLHALKIVLS